MADSQLVDIDAEELDPRVQIQLEKLNSCTDEINRLEVELDEANAIYRNTLSVSSQKLNALRKKFDKAIAAARPYYEARQRAQSAQRECQRAALHYQRASEIHQAATETIALAEQRFLSKQTEWAFDTAWQEMLNHATEKVTVAKAQMVESQTEHRRRAAIFKEAEECVKSLEERLRKEIKKSRAYFEAVERFEKSLREIKARTDEKRRAVCRSKEAYNEALHALEHISSEIHEKRKSRLCFEDLKRKIHRDSGYQELTPSSSTSGDLHEGLQSIIGQFALDEGCCSQSHLGSDSHLASLQDFSISQSCSSLASSVSSAADKSVELSVTMGSLGSATAVLPTISVGDVSSKVAAAAREFVEIPLDD